MFTSKISKIVVILLVVATILVSTSFVTHATSANRMYDGIEQLRNSRSFPSNSNMASYEQIESARTQRSLSLSTDDYGVIEQLRSARELSADRSFDAIELIRVQRGK